MAIAFNSIFLVILFCGSALGTRIHLFSVKSQPGTSMSALSSSASGGMCNTVVKTKGYTCEEHTVTTQDGYILSMQRIPVGRSGGSAGDRPPVLLQHGLLSDGFVWLASSPEQALSFLLANNGFDVWIANGRGTVYSLGHKSLSPDNAVIFLIHSRSYDLTAMFQYVYKKTGQNLHYVAHSQGTLMALAALSKNQLLDMWRSASLLAPISYMGQITSQFVRVAAESMLAEESFWLHLGEFNILKGPEIELMAIACQTKGVNCTDPFSVVSGKNCCQNSSAESDVVAHGLQSSASKNMIHFAQMVTRGTITMFDYDNKDENKKHYGQTVPPVYNLKSIPNDFPLFLCHGGADTLADVYDVQHLVDTLKDHAGDKLVVRYIEKYGHSDFLLGVDAKKEVYDPLMAFLKLH
ncbi:triacylglycerol lipase 2-like [Pistacia vera]|uniref:triacylglycerol lipase 2-like n=1 Tax=Pistacia vera TaxID=55513 RepID=UPI001263C727|nr:triacylglycerol lipase 2-like [Pistacia vera]